MPSPKQLSEHSSSKIPHSEEIPNLTWEQRSIELSDSALTYLLDNLSYPVFFDSGKANHLEKFNIVSGEPLKIYVDSEAKDALEQIEEDARTLPEIPPTFRRIPFAAGLIGFTSYDFGEDEIIGQQISKSQKAPPLSDSAITPTIYIGAFTWSLCRRLSENDYTLTFSPHCPLATRTKVINLVNKANTAPAPPIDTDVSKIKWCKTTSEASYIERIQKIQSYINQGDCYQVNFTQRFTSHSDIPPLHYYMSLREKTLTPYSCFMQLGEHCYLLSFSPEQFIGIENGRIETKPIKGTIENDNGEATVHKLKNSQKDKAENLMIVDLLRNDLSKVCQLNSVKVDKLFSLETFNNVHHLVSHISGQLKPEVSELSAFLSCFPGGSITGAPKKRAMEIIRELEDERRSAYCGSVFYLNHDGRFDSNILIRTIVQNRGALYCWGGGGIVSDSEPKAEYKESLIKVANLTQIRE